MRHQIDLSHLSKKFIADLNTLEAFLLHDPNLVRLFLLLRRSPALASLHSIAYLIDLQTSGIKDPTQDLKQFAHVEALKPFFQLLQITEKLAIRALCSQTVTSALNVLQIKSIYTLLKEICVLSLRGLQIEDPKLAILIFNNIKEVFLSMASEELHLFGLNKKLITEALQFFPSLSENAYSENKALIFLIPKINILQSNLKALIINLCPLLAFQASHAKSLMAPLLPPAKGMSDIHWLLNVTSDKKMIFTNRPLLKKLCIENHHLVPPILIEDEIDESQLLMRTMSRELMVSFLKLNPYARVFFLLFKEGSLFLHFAGLSGLLDNIVAGLDLSTLDLTNKVIFRWSFSKDFIENQYIIFEKIYSLIEAALGIDNKVPSQGGDPVKRLQARITFHLITSILDAIFVLEQIDTNQDMIDYACSIIDILHAFDDEELKQIKITRTMLPLAHRLGSQSAKKQNINLLRAFNYFMTLMIDLARYGNHDPNTPNPLDLSHDQGDVANLLLVLLDSYRLKYSFIRFTNFTLTTLINAARAVALKILTINLNPNINNIQPFFDEMMYVAYLLFKDPAVPLISASSSHSGDGPSALPSLNTFLSFSRRFIRPINIPLAMQQHFFHPPLSLMPTQHTSSFGQNTNSFWGNSSPSTHSSEEEEDRFEELSSSDSDDETERPKPR